MLSLKKLFSKNITIFQLLYTLDSLHNRLRMSKEQQVMSPHQADAVQRQFEEISRDVNVRLLKLLKIT